MLKGVLVAYQGWLTSVMLWEIARLASYQSYYVFLWFVLALFSFPVSLILFFPLLFLTDHKTLWWIVTLERTCRVHATRAFNSKI